MPLTMVGMAGGHGIEPAAAAGAAGGGAEFTAHAVQQIGDFLVLGRQRPFAHAGGVGFHHPTTRSMRCGGTPEPVQAPPAVVLDEVTNGYVP
jgi:hypothetical protein